MPHSTPDITPPGVNATRLTVQHAKYHTPWRKCYKAYRISSKIAHPWDKFEKHFSPKQEVCDSTPNENGGSKKYYLVERFPWASPGHFFIYTPPLVEKNKCGNSSEGAWCFTRYKHGNLQPNEFMRCCHFVIVQPGPYKRSIFLPQ